MMVAWHPLVIDIGICLIFEHEEFKPSMALSQRKGSEADLKMAQRCFVSMGFEVKITALVQFKHLLPH